MQCVDYEYMLHASEDIIFLSGLDIPALNKHSDVYNRLLSEHLCGVYTLRFTCLSANTNKQLLAAVVQYVIEMQMFSR